MERNAGTTIFGRLELIREEASSVGVQVFGPTWAVFDSVTGELARACILDAELLPDEPSRQRFISGLDPLAKLGDFTLVPQLFVGADEQGGGVLYEPLAGGVAFDDLYDGTGSFDLSAEVGRLARALARALASLHARGQVHGMLTSASVFIGPRGPAVYQYGLAPLCERSVLLRRVRAFNLPNIAPEVLAGGDFTPAADLYAWAVTLAQFAASTRGPAALEAARGAQELPGLSPALRTALQSCLSDDPAARPRDGAELLRLIELAGLGDTPRADESTADRPVASESAEPETAASPAPVASAPASPAAPPAPSEAPSAPVAQAPEVEPTPDSTGTAATASQYPSHPSHPSPPHPSNSAHPPVPSPPAPVSVPASAGVAVPAFVPLLPAMKPVAPPRPPTLPPAPTAAHGARPPAPPAKGPTTITPPVPRSLPITSFEERLTADDRPRRPATIPPGSMTASPQTPVAMPPVTLASTASTASTVSTSSSTSPTTSPAHPAIPAAVREVIELMPDDMLNESWRGGKSASNLRRVHVLTDPIHRSPEDGEAAASGRMALPDDVPQTTPQRSPSRGEMIIGGTREEVDAASRATTVRLDPASAAAAVLAATEAAASSALRIASDPPTMSPAPDRRRALDPSSSSSLEVATDSGAHEPAVSQTDSAAASLDNGAPLSGSSRRRSSALSTSNGEPRDWGTIPPLSQGSELVSATPTATSAALGRARPEVAGPRKLPLLPILVVVALALLAMLYIL